MLTEMIKQKIKNHALECLPNECCGFIVSTGDDYDILACANKSQNPTKHFIISGEDYLKASDKNIVAVYHSHPLKNAISFADKVCSNNQELLFVIYFVNKDSFETYSPRKLDYFGKPFVLGVNDCFSLLRDYFRNELGIVINEYPRINNWQESIGSIMDDSFEKEGFVKILTGPVKNSNFDQLQENDILLFNSIGKKNAAHIGVYLDNNIFLHHPRGGFSRLEPYNKVYKRITKYAIRHNSFRT